MNTAAIESIVITIVSRDKPGIVDTLSHLVTEHEGNWTESSMMSLAGQFAGIVLAQIPGGRSEAFLAAVRRLDSQGMDIVARPAGPAEPGVEFSEHHIELVGQDRPGIVAEITSVLARHGVNVRELETTVQSASMSGESLFIAHAQLEVPTDADLELLRDNLESLANELMVDLSLDEPA